MKLNVAILGNDASVLGAVIASLGNQSFNPTPIVGVPDAEKFATQFSNNHYHAFVVAFGDPSHMLGAVDIIHAKVGGTQDKPIIVFVNLPAVTHDFSGTLMDAGAQAIVTSGLLNLLGPMVKSWHAFRMQCFEAGQRAMTPKRGY